MFETYQTTKSTGSGWIFGRFYERNWATIKVEVINVVKLFFLNSHMPDVVDSKRFQTYYFMYCHV
jgi:hypothetical protein